VDAKNNYARQFYTEFGFVAFTEKETRLLLRMEAIEKLFPEPAS
jgi:hypothetical protein